MYRIVHTVTLKERRTKGQAQVTQCLRAGQIDPIACRDSRSPTEIPRRRGEVPALRSPIRGRERRLAHGSGEAQMEQTELRVLLET